MNFIHGEIKDKWMIEPKSILLFWKISRVLEKELPSGIHYAECENTCSSSNLASAQNSSMDLAPNVPEYVNLKW